jgi:hypothetical protein
MITGDPVGDFFLWLLFSLVLVWALWQGLWDFAEWLEQHSDNRLDLQSFPDEVWSDLAPGMFATSRRKMEPRDERSVRQAIGEGAGRVVAVPSPDPSALEGASRSRSNPEERHLSKNAASPSVNR